MKHGNLWMLGCSDVSFEKQFFLQSGVNIKDEIYIFFSPTHHHLSHRSTHRRLWDPGVCKSHLSCSLNGLNNTDAWFYFPFSSPGSSAASIALARQGRWSTWKHGLWSYSVWSELAQITWQSISKSEDVENIWLLSSTLTCALALP